MLLRYLSYSYGFVTFGWTWYEKASTIGSASASVSGSFVIVMRPTFFLDELTEIDLFEER
jgi:hypothetical protein